MDMQIAHQRDDIEGVEEVLHAQQSILTLRKVLPARSFSRTCHILPFLSSNNVDLLDLLDSFSNNSDAKHLEWAVTRRN